MGSVYETKRFKNGKIGLPKPIVEKYFGDKLCITISPHPGLQVYSSERWEAFSDRAITMPKDTRNLMRHVFARAQYVYIEKSGVLVPEDLAVYANLSDRVLIEENADGFTISRVDVTL